MSVNTEMQLSEPVILALLKVLEENMPDFIESLNEEFEDEAVLSLPVQFLPWRPTQADWEAGLPCIGVAELPTRFEDDNVSMLTAVHSICIWVVVQEADHGTLAKLLRRYVRLITLAIQRDRAHLSGPGKNIMILSRETQSVWGLKFEGIVPGDMLEERTPDSPSESPTSYLSWSGVIVSMKREEIG